MTENERQKLIKACASILFDAVIEIIYADPHQWSKRGCDTCRTISAIIGKPFGCYRYQKEKATEE